MVVLQHEGGVLTVYAHHSKNLVRVGQKVKEGQKIALSGRSGRARGPHLHFEVRSHESPVDPMMVLQAPKIAVQEEGPLEYEEEDALALDGNGLGEELSKLATAPSGS
jgi:murein DD-endopeptidase MepM/ murein hydrolase activator NlpD